MLLEFLVTLKAGAGIFLVSLKANEIGFFLNPQYICALLNNCGDC